MALCKHINDDAVSIHRIEERLYSIQVLHCSAVFLCFLDPRRFFLNVLEGCPLIILRKPGRDIFFKSFDGVLENRFNVRHSIATSHIGRHLFGVSAFDRPVIKYLSRERGNSKGRKSKS